MIVMATTYDSGTAFSSTVNDMGGLKFPSKFSFTTFRKVSGEETVKNLVSYF
ncbi:MAG: hypothetical protein ACPLZG_10870 [Thermoproteota archaeon]|jgi:hypothetical protein